MSPSTGGRPDWLCPPADSRLTRLVTRRIHAPTALVAILAALFVGLAASCSFVNPPALVVEGPPGQGDVVLTDPQFQSELKVIANDKTLSSGLAQGADPYTSVAKNQYTPAFVAAILSSHVQLQALVNEAARRNIFPTAEELTSTEDGIVKQIEGAGQGAAGADPAAKKVDGQATLAKLGGFRDLLLRGIAAQAKLQTAITPSDEDMRKAYEGAKDKLGESACASHILILASKAQPDAQTGQPATATDEEYAAALAKINDIQKQLDAGGVFADIAKATSEDPGSGAKGGELGCVSEKGKYVKAFDDAVWSQPIGVVGPPVKTEYGYHLIKVTRRGTPAFDEVKQQISDALAKEASGKVVKDAFAAIEVTVDPRYGSWEASKGSVVPPGGAATPTVPTTPTTAFDPSGLGLGGTPDGSPSGPPRGSSSGSPAGAPSDSPAGAPSSPADVPPAGADGR